MELNTEQLSTDSEEEFAQKLLHLIDSGAGVIHVKANEILRAVSVIRRTALLDKAKYLEWDVVNGFRDKFTTENYIDEGETGDNNIDVNAVFQKPLEDVRSKKIDSKTSTIYVYNNIHPYIENNPHIQQLMLIYNDYLPTCKAVVIMVTPDQPLPESPATPSIMTLRLTPPGIAELLSTIKNTLKPYEEGLPEIAAFDDDSLTRICYAGSGMSLLQFETYVATATVAAYRKEGTELTCDDIEREVRKGKTDIVNSSDILELYPSESINDVGGMGNLKEWIQKRSRCYSEEAKEFGVEAPKGMVLVGVPGTGKSLVAKAVAGELGVPLVRFDFSRVFSSLVGSSEARMRGALSMVEAMAPCVLFCDEIDKGLGGIANGGSGDSGISMRVLGSFLTWLQDCKKPVFTMVTANNIHQLPPELLRRGRFDAIFATAMPTERERRDVLEIHLRKRGRDIADFSEADIVRYIRASDRYVPAEIESAVKDAVTEAFAEGAEVTMDGIIDALHKLIPISKSYKLRIEEMEKWAAENATPVAAPETPEPPPEPQGNVRTMRATPSRRTIPKNIH